MRQDASDYIGLESVPSAVVTAAWKHQAYLEGTSAKAPIGLVVSLRECDKENIPVQVVLVKGHNDCRL